MYRVLYLRFAARFLICGFSSGVKCWYGDRLDVSVVTSHVTTAYNFAEKTFTNWLQTAKVFSVFVAATFITKSGSSYWSSYTTMAGVLANFGPNSQDYTARMAQVSH